MQLAKAYRSLPRPSSASEPSYPLNGLLVFSLRCLLCHANAPTLTRRETKVSLQFQVPPDSLPFGRGTEKTFSSVASPAKNLAECIYNLLPNKIILISAIF